jgi:hypothetical protein
MGHGDVAAAMDRQSERLLPAVLRSAGYHTGAVSTNLWVSPACGFATGFDDFAAIDAGRQAKINASDNRPRLDWMLEAVRGQVDDGAAEAGSVLRRWSTGLERDRSFFWFVNLIECHSPYLPPRPYGGLGRWARGRAAVEAHRHLNFLSILRTCAGGEPVAPAALERMRQLYAGAIRYLDDWIADLLEALDASGALAETTVIITADHGENLGEGGLITHALSLDDRLIRVPFVAAGPGADRFAGIRSLAELPRRIASVANVDGTPWEDQELPRGAAVAQLDPPVDAGDPRAREAIERWGLSREGFGRLTESQICATDGRWKILCRGRKELLFDIVADPLEQSPLPLDQAATRAGGDPPLATLRAALAHPAAVDVRHPVVAPTPVEIDPAELSRIEDRMRLLGYL